MSEKPHSHACTRCGTPTPCDGPRERNYDGFPPVICLSFHLPGGVINPACLCDGCREQQA